MKSFSLISFILLISSLQFASVQAQDILGEFEQYTYLKKTGSLCCIPDTLTIKKSPEGLSAKFAYNNTNVQCKGLFKLPNFGYMDIILSESKPVNEGDFESGFRFVSKIAYGSEAVTYNFTAISAGLIKIKTSEKDERDADVCAFLMSETDTSISNASDIGNPRNSISLRSILFGCLWFMIIFAALVFYKKYKDRRLQEELEKAAQENHKEGLIANDGYDVKDRIDAIPVQSKNPEIYQPF